MQPSPLTYPFEDQGTVGDFQALTGGLQEAENNGPDAILRYVQTVLPGWINNTAKSFSSELRTMESNWAKICEKNKTERQQILLCKPVYYDKYPDKTFFLRFVCDLMSYNGFVIRNVENFELCKKCAKAMPSEEICINAKIPYDGYCEVCRFICKKV